MGGGQNSDDIQAAQVSEDITQDTQTDDDTSLLSNDGEDVQASDNSEILKDSSEPIVITYENFSNYFDNNGKILDSVPEDSVLDFQGIFDVSDGINAVYINKPVKITSSTKDAIFILNTVYGESGSSNLNNRFVIEGVSSFQMSDVTLEKTQLAILDSSNVVLDNIKVINKDYSVSSNNFIGFLELNRLNNLTLKNSYFDINKTISDFVDCFSVFDATFDNNTFIYIPDGSNTKSLGISIVKIKRVLDGQTIVSDRVVLKNNNIYINDFEVSNPSLVNINHITVISYNTFIENNTIKFENEFLSGGFTQIGYRGTNYNVTIKDLITPSIALNGISGKTVMDNCVVTTDQTSLTLTNAIVNNCVLSSVTLNRGNSLINNSSMRDLTITTSYDNITLENNNITGNVNLKVKSSNFKNNTFDKTVTIEGESNNISGNTFKDTLTLKDKNTVVQNNVFNASASEYAIIIPDSDSYTNINITNNVIHSRDKSGDEAISCNRSKINVENNSPLNVVLNLTFDKPIAEYGETVNLLINSTVDFNVTLDINGKKETIEVTNGITQIPISSYELGVNNITVSRQDDEYIAFSQASFEVKKVSVCPIELDYGNGTVGKSLDVTVILPDDANGTIVLTITDGVYSVQLKQAANGKNNLLTVPSLFEGKYTISAEFTSIKYVTNSTSGVISFNKPVTPAPKPVVKEVPTLKAAKKTVTIKKSAKKLVLKATLKINGKAKKGLKVIFKFKGKKYTAKTNAKGVAKVTIKKNVIKKLKKGKKYTANITYGKKVAKTVVKVKK